MSNYKLLPLSQLLETKAPKINISTFNIIRKSFNPKTIDKTHQIKLLQTLNKLSEEFQTKNFQQIFIKSPSIK